MHRVLAPQKRAALEKVRVAEEKTPKKAAGGTDYERGQRNRNLLNRFLDFAALLRDSSDAGQQIEGLMWQLEMKPFLERDWQTLEMPDLVALVGELSLIHI